MRREYSTVKTRDEYPYVYLSFGIGYTTALMKFGAGRLINIEFSNPVILHTCTCFFAWLSRQGPSLTLDEVIKALEANGFVNANIPTVA